MSVQLTNHTILPHQLRAGRALAGVTMETLAQVAGVAANTVMRIECAESVPTRNTASRIIQALARLDVLLVHEGDGAGVGVRMREPGGNAVVLRRDPLKDGEIGVVVVVDGKPFTGRVIADALAPGGTIAEALTQFDLRRPQIARAIARKLRAQAFDNDGNVRLTGDDLAQVEEAHA